jgi:precorrin-3B C17-methyltransferase
MVEDVDKAESQGRIIVVGLGPGKREHVTLRASQALQQADVILGYKTYLNLIRSFLAEESQGKELISSGMTHEVERAVQAVELAAAGKIVVVVSSGDAGIYGMAGIVHEAARQKGWKSIDVEVVPGVSAVNAAAALLGAPLIHDFATISLSDLLTPWDLIERRLEAAAQADFVIVLYNPKSAKRVQQIAEARRIVLEHRPGTTPVGVVTAAYRETQRVTVTDLEHMLDAEIGMQTTVIIGNSSTTACDGVIVTPRGYRTAWSDAGEE